jgi:pimeloyl-ACP methyl ester carboxylesterase
MTTAVEPAGHRVEINGRSLHYVEYPAPAPGATAVVMLHGLTSAWGGWRRVAEHLAARYHVFALDQRGHGDSEWAPADRYRTDDYLDDLERFVDGLGLDRFILIGQSMGGHHTIAYTARHPDRVICAIANDIPPAVQRDANADYSQQYPGGRQRTFATVEDWIATRRPTAPLTPEWAHELMAREALKAVDGGFQPKHDPNAAMHWQPADLWAEARTITRPILFIRGGRSQVLDAQTLQDMDMAIPTARSVTLEQAGHSTYFDMEHEWLAAADAFLAAHARTG